MRIFWLLIFLIAFATSSWAQTTTTAATTTTTTIITAFPAGYTAYETFKGVAKKVGTFTAANTSLSFGSEGKKPTVIVDVVTPGGGTPSISFSGCQPSSGMPFVTPQAGLYTAATADNVQPLTVLCRAYKFDAATCSAACKVDLYVLEER